MMKIDAFKPEDLDDFLAFATRENWICGQWEFDFLLRHFPQGCLTTRLDNRPVAFITAIKYEKSGWIGNLVVRSDLRGNGIGSALMDKALAALLGAGARTVWLTASEAGRSIYERLGFGVIDIVKRWNGIGSGGGDGATGDCPKSAIMAIDRAGWGDGRESILAEALKRGKLAVCDGGFMISQPAAAGLQLGPWGTTESEAARILLAAVRARAGEGTRLFLDAPAGNGDASQLFQGQEFVVRGASLLMYLGEKPAYKPERIYALASMGSMG